MQSAANRERPVSASWGYAQARICRLAAGQSLTLPSGSWHRLVLLSGRIETALASSPARQVLAGTGEPSAIVDLGQDGAVLMALSDAQMALYSTDKRLA